MRPIEQIKSILQDTITACGKDGLQALYSTNRSNFLIQASWGEGWEHISVSIPYTKRMPTWDEMCMIKDLFWLPEETVVQYHPAKSEYINMHKYCLHLWRPINEKLPMPPKIMVGI